MSDQLPKFVPDTSDNGEFPEDVHELAEKLRRRKRVLRKRPDALPLNSGIQDPLDPNFITLK